MMTTFHSNEHDATDLRVGSVCVINNSFVDAVASVQYGNAIIDIKYIAASELNSLISLIGHELAASSNKSYPNIKHHESTSYYYYY